MRPRPLDLGKPADRWRLRLVIYDAAHELVWPERRQSFAGLAKSAKMRKGNYIKGHKFASAVLQEALHGGRTGFRKALWSAQSSRYSVLEGEMVGSCCDGLSMQGVKLRHHCGDLLLCFLPSLKAYGI